MEEVWNINYDGVKTHYEKNGHLSGLRPKLQRWLSYQRLHAKTLTDEQLNKLDKIRYKDCPVVRDKDETTWEQQFSALKQAKERFDHVRNLNSGSSSWLTRQRQAFSNGELDPVRAHKLEALGIDLELNISKRNKTKITKANQEKWMAKFRKYQEYQAENGHGNVPRRYKVDQLGEWVQGHRKDYNKMKNATDPTLRERFRLLNEIKFAWKHRKINTHE